MPAEKIFNLRTGNGLLRGLFSGIILARMRLDLVNSLLAMR